MLMTFFFFKHVILSLSNSQLTSSVAGQLFMPDRARVGWRQMGWAGEDSSHKQLTGGKFC